MDTFVYDENDNVITPGDFIARFGTQVFAQDVPGLVRAGIAVWSYGYGQEDNDDPGTFTTLDPSDFWFDGEPSADDVNELAVCWGPFAVQWED